MIERVKKAVRNEWGSRLCKPNEYLERPCEHGSICACLEVARAAIEAMRSTTDEMLVCGEQWGLPSDPMGLKRWQEMIDAALEGK
jgi:hypothetical protein